MTEDLKKKIISDIMYFYENYEDNNIMKSDYCCDYWVNNVFMKNKSKKYYYSNYLKEIRKKNMNKKNNYRVSEEKNDYIIRLIFKEPASANTKYKFEFKKVNNGKNKKIYLASSNFFTRRDRKITDIKKKIKDNGQIIGDIFTLEQIQSFENDTLKVKLNKNTTDSNNTLNIYHIVIVEEENIGNFGNTKIHISKPFSLISFKQLIKRAEKSFIGKKYNRKESDLLYYINAIFEEKKVKLKNVFRFQLDFYTKKDSYIGEIENYEVLGVNQNLNDDNLNYKFSNDIDNFQNIYYYNIENNDINMFNSNNINNNNSNSFIYGNNSNNEINSINYIEGNYNSNILNNYNYANYEYSTNYDYDIYRKNNNSNGN